MLITSFIINKNLFDFLIFFNHYSDNQESLYNFMGISIGGDICLTPTYVICMYCSYTFSITIYS